MQIFDDLGRIFCASPASATIDRRGVKVKQCSLDSTCVTLSADDGAGHDEKRGGVRTTTTTLGENQEKGMRGWMDFDEGRRALRVWARDVLELGR